MSTRFLLVALICAFTFSFDSAFAEEELPKTPNAFEERAQVLLGVDQDEQALLSLALRVARTYSDHGDWVAAMVRVANHAGEAGYVRTALGVLSASTTQQQKGMSEELKAAVRAATKRWLPAGESAPVPGTNGIETLEAPMVRDTAGGPSPLEKSVRKLYEPVAQASDPGEVNKAQDSVAQALADAGPEILPVLARIADGTPGAVGRHAAALLARMGGPDALPYLAQLLASDNAITRGTAIRSLRDLMSTKSATWWARYGTWLESATKSLSAAERELLRDRVLLNRLDADELWARYEQGGSDAYVYLSTLANRRGDPRAFRAAIAGLADEDLPQAARDSCRSILRSASGNTRGRVIGPLLADVDEKTIRRVVDAFRESNAVSGFNPQHSAVWVLGRWGGDEGARAAIVDDLWRGALQDASSPTIEGNGLNFIASMLRSFVDADYLPPKGICQDEALCRTFFSQLPAIISSRRIGPLFKEQPTLYDRMFDVMPQLDLQERTQLLTRVLGSAPPPSTRWSELLALPPFRVPSQSDRILPSIIIEMARADDPALWPWIKKHVEDADYPEGMAKVVGALGHRPSDDVLAFARRALARAGGMSLKTLGQVTLLLDYRYIDVERDSEYGRSALETLGRLASDPAHPAAVLAVRKLSGLEEDARLVPLFAQALELQGRLPEGWRDALIAAADDRLLIEAAPFLIDQYRAKREPRVAQVLDKLREHRDRLASFENWRANEGKAAVEELLTQLDATDAQERRAAILALAAMREVRALPRLAKLATKDPDEAVRKAAMAALERLAGMND